MRHSLRELGGNNVINRLQRHASLAVRKSATRAAPKGSTQHTVVGRRDDDFEEDEDGFLDLDIDEDEIDGRDAEDVVGALGLGEDDQEPGTSTGGTFWGEAGLRAAEKVLKAPALDGLAIYMFRAIVPQKKLDIRLDKLTDLYGSPSIDDIEKFSRMMFLEMEAQLGTEAAGEVSFEVSSPGAERQLLLPQDLARFQQLPLRVEYTDSTGSPITKVLELVTYDEEACTTTWRLANVRANAPVKGRSLSKKQKEQTFEIAVSSLIKLRIHVDF
ncbi:hypothetical protein CEUSTIGMA_g7633.t1 [Chlamydomonas eustigma]|uniref:DUF7912 domain-containing protein n=1 Tax=Chlamydomonas eustigma TaxID=1157962 RepID=A0A250XAR3_9CHLO|nr:hypothetical protein CEUSTIGMA_g7633.t1 [Chlamydomonas eustigma]|eukprot:GAX80195.1 hypothetical protein CEUSTIGMA_g7633.t1 [Chlamydomonas eustigma]